MNILHDDEDLLIRDFAVGCANYSRVAVVIKCDDAPMLQIHEITDLLVEAVPCHFLFLQIVRSENLDGAEVV